MPAPSARRAEASHASTRASAIRRIDAHTHFASLKFLDFAERHDGKPFMLGDMYRRNPTLTDATARLDLLDRNEIDVHVLVPVPWLDAFPRIANDPTLAVEAARMINDEVAALVSACPTRFCGVAILPMIDPDAAVDELHRAVEKLGFAGGYLPVGPTVKRTDHPDCEALYKAIVHLDVALWLHPSRPPLPDYVDEDLSRYEVWRTFGWPLDTTTAMHRIVFSGVFDRYPGIRIITHHHGGFVPYYAPRMVGGWDQYETSGAAVSTRISKPYIEHFKKFYCDTACNDFAPKVLDMALEFFGPERVLFGSDAPFGTAQGQTFTAAALSSIDAMDISPQVRQAVLSGNSSQILKLT